jgi:hypothetical protein
MTVVYFIQQGSGPVKIGIASDVLNRLANLQCSNPYPLRVRMLIPGGLVLEGTLHTYFAESHISGEWFDPLEDERLDTFMDNALVRLAEHVYHTAPHTAQAMLDDGFINRADLPVVQRAARGLDRKLVAEVPDLPRRKIRQYFPFGDQPVSQDNCPCGGRKATASRLCRTCNAARASSRYAMSIRA